mgnify:CR=1 FL=1
MIAAPEGLREQMFEGHQGVLHGMAVGVAEGCADRGDLGGAGLGGRVGDGVLGAVAAPAGGQLHARDVEGLVGQGRQGLAGVGPAGQGALEPVGVVAPGVVFPVVGAAALGALEGAMGHAEGEFQHLLHPIGGDQLRVGAGPPGCDTDAAAPDQQLLQLLYKNR